MKTVPHGSPKCPDCEADDPQISATVSAGMWERHFYTCPECELGLVGNWYSTHAPQVSVSDRSPIPAEV